MFLMSSGVTGYSSTESILKLIGLIILCILIIAASYYVTRLIGTSKAGTFKSTNFRPIDAYRLSPNKYLQLIRIGSRYVVIAVCKDSVSFVCELKEDEVTTVTSDPGKMVSFKDIFAKSLKKDRSTVSESSENTEESKEV